MIRFVFAPGVLALVALLAFRPSLPAAAWEEPFRVLQETAATACAFPSETVVLAYDPAKRVLRVGRELRLNPTRTRIEVQLVKIDVLPTEIPIEGIGKLPDPWLKVRTIDGRKHVQVQRENRITGDDEFVEEQPDRPVQEFLIIPCQPKQIRTFRDALQVFLSAAKGS